MRLLLVFVVSLAFLLIGLTVGQKTQSEDALQKVKALEERLAETERKVAELERKVAELKKQLAQMSAVPRPPTVQLPPFQFPGLALPEAIFLYRQPPEVKPGFGLPQPAPFPFVQPYYYPLGREH